MNLSKILAINLKYYRKKYNLSQEKFAEILGTTLSYLNQIGLIYIPYSLSIFECSYCTFNYCFTVWVNK